MKKIFIILFFVAFPSYCFSQDTVYVEGIFIQRYLKNETLFRMNNDSLGKQSKSYQQMIDYEVQIFYCTLKINSNIILMNENDIETIICTNQNYKNVEIYKFLNHGENSYYFSVPVSLSKESQYYVNSHDTNHVYNIYRVKGNAVRYEVKNDYFSKQRRIDLEIKWSIDSFSLNKNIPCFYLYKFYDFDIYDIFPMGFEVWTLR